MEVSGSIGLAELVGASGRLRWRVFGLWRYACLGLYAIYLGVGFLLFQLVDRMSRADLLRGHPDLYLVIFVATMLVSVVVIARLYRGLMRRVQIGIAAARGHEDPAAVTVAATPEGLRIAGATSDTRVAWAGISEIAPTPTQWLFITGGMGYVVPRRFFPDVETQRAFLRLALGHMAETARARSKKAVAFAGKPAG
jgi:hypothetical protein